MPKYRKKPVEVEAVKFEFTAQSFYEVCKLVRSPRAIIVDFENGSPTLKITTREGDITARVGDYIIKGVEGEIYACKPRIFEKTYDRVDVSKKARKMAELSEMVTKSGVNFTEKKKPSLTSMYKGIDVDLSGVKGVKLVSETALETAKTKDLSVDKIKPGPIESQEISPANSFEIEREAHKKLIKELIREVLDDEKTSKTLAKTALREMGIEMKRAELRS